MKRLAENKTTALTSSWRLSRNLWRRGVINKGQQSNLVPMRQSGCAYANTQTRPPSVCQLQPQQAPHGLYCINSFTLTKRVATPKVLIWNTARPGCLPSLPIESVTLLGARCAPGTEQQLDSVGGSRTVPRLSCCFIHYYSLQAIITCRIVFLSTKIFILRSQNRSNLLNFSLTLQNVVALGKRNQSL